MQVYYRCCKHCYPTDQFHQSGMQDRHVEPCLLCPDGRANIVDVELEVEQKRKRMVAV